MVPPQPNKSVPAPKSFAAAKAKPAGDSSASRDAISEFAPLDLQALIDAASTDSQGESTVDPAALQAADEISRIRHSILD